MTETLTTMMDALTLAKWKMASRALEVLLTLLTRALRLHVGTGCDKVTTKNVMTATQRTMMAVLRAAR
jgi:hypothetical protein